MFSLALYEVPKGIVSRNTSVKLKEKSSHEDKQRFCSKLTAGRQRVSGVTGTVQLPLLAHHGTVPGPIFGHFSKGFCPDDF